MPAVAIYSFRRAAENNLGVKDNRLGTSINAEVVSRLEKSLTLPSSEQLSELLRVVARRYPQVMEEPSVKTLIENLEEAAL